MNKVEVLNDFNKINESKITNEELLDFVHKLGYNSIDEIKKEKSKLAKLEALFNELNLDNGEKAKKVEEDDVKSGSGEGSDTGSTSGDDTTSNTGSDKGGDTGSDKGGDTSSDKGGDTGSDKGGDTGSTSGDDTTSGTGSTSGDDTTSDTGSTSGDDTTTTNDDNINKDHKSKTVHIKSFAEFCGEIEEDEDDKTDSNTMNESAKITSDEEFEEYAMNILKKAHPDDFNEEEAKKTIEDILKDHNGDYGAAIGALNNGLSK